MGFTTPLRIEKQNDLWVLTDNLVYENDKYIITVLKTFDFDGGTIPLLAQPLIGCPMGDNAESYCLHDALYACRLFSFEDSNRLLNEAMKSQKADNLVRYAVKLGVTTPIAYGHWLRSAEDMAKYREFINITLKG